MSVAYADEIGARTRGSSLVIWLVGLVVLVFIVWAKFAWIDEIVRAEGEIVSSARPQIVQNLEGGILAELLVSEGDVVEPGQVLARLRGTNFQSRVQDYVEQIDALTTRKLRLEAEMAGQSTFEAPADIAGRNSSLVASEAALLAARQADYISRTEGAARIVAETRRELEVMEDLLAREIAALIEVTRARNALSDAEIRYNEIVTGTELERAAEYSQTLQELNQIEQEMRVAQDQLSRTIITSPMRGVINNLGVTTIGGVIRPGEEIFQIIPLDDELFVEAQVMPQDIATVVPGQRATVKLTAYDYTVYGSLDGEVMVVSADTFEDERRADLPETYRVTLRVDLENLDARQAQIAIRPGMQATVELHTGAKTVLTYLLRPLYRSREALREP